jgi:hypothetical protein
VSLPGEVAATRGVKEVVYKCEVRRGNGKDGVTAKHTKEYDVKDVFWDYHMSSIRPIDMPKPIVMTAGNEAAATSGENHKP